MMAKNAVNIHQTLWVLQLKCFVLQSLIWQCVLLLYILELVSLAYIEIKLYALREAK